MKSNARVLVWATLLCLGTTCSWLKRAHADTGMGVRICWPGPCAEDSGGQTRKDTGRAGDGRRDPPVSSDWDGIKGAGRAVGRGIKAGAKGVAKAGKAIGRAFNPRGRRRERERKQEENRQRLEEKKAIDEAYRMTQIAREGEQRMERARYEEQTRLARERRVQAEQALQSRYAHEVARNEDLQSQVERTRQAVAQAADALAREAVEAESDCLRAVAQDPSAFVATELLQNHVIRTSLAEEVNESRGLSGATFSSHVPGSVPDVQTPDGTPFRTGPENELWTELVAAADQYAVVQRRLDGASDKKIERQALVDASGMLIHRADELLATGQNTSGFMTLERAREFLDFAVDLGLAFYAPPLFAAKSVIELATGRNFLTGSELTTEQQVFNVLNAALVGAGKGVRLVKQSSEFLQGVVAKRGAGAGLAEKMMGYLEVADQAARRERSWRRKLRESLMWEQATKTGAYVGLATDEKIIAKVGTLAPHEIHSAIHFGGLEGVLALRDVEVVETLSRWGVGQEGFNQAPAHLFGLGREWPATQGRWQKVEEILAAKTRKITRALRQDAEGRSIIASEKEIKEALLALDEAAEKVEKYASYSYKIGDSEFFWYGPIKLTPKTTGLRLSKYKGQKQSFFPQKYGEWAKSSQKAAEKTP